MPLCNNFADDNYYFNTKPEEVAKYLGSVFSNTKSKNEYRLICHILRESKEVFFTIVKPLKENTTKYISTYTTLENTYKRCINDKFKIKCIGISINYSIKHDEVTYYE